MTYVPLYKSTNQKENTFSVLTPTVELSRTALLAFRTQHFMKNKKNLYWQASVSSPLGCQSLEHEIFVMAAFCNSAFYLNFKAFVAFIW